MFAAVIGFLKSLFGATQAAADAARQRDAELNTADQRANSEAAQIQKDKDRAVADITNPDQTNLNRDVAP